MVDRLLDDRQARRDRILGALPDVRTSAEAQLDVLERLS